MFEMEVLEALEPLLNEHVHLYITEDQRMQSLTQLKLGGATLYTHEGLKAAIGLLPLGALEKGKVQIETHALANGRALDTLLDGTPPDYAQCYFELKHLRKG